MAMRPAVLRHTIIIIVFSVVQWGFMRYILNHQLFNLDTYRILYFSMSSFIAGFFIIAALIYLVLKGNTDTN